MTHDGAVYEGGFEDGYIQGVGKMTEVTGAVYDGAWDKGLKHGEGTADNSVFPSSPTPALPTRQRLMTRILMVSTVLVVC